MNLKRLLLILCMLYGGFTLAQAPAGLWGEAEIGYKITSKIKLTLGEEMRLRENLSKIDRFETTLGATYKFNKYFKAGAGYTFIKYNHPDGYWENRQRFYAEAQGEYKVYRVTMSLREKVQSTYREGVIETSARANPKLYVKSRVEASYSVKNSGFDPYISAEFFNTINDPQKNELTKIRYTFGTKYKINKKNSLNLFYRYVTEKFDDDIEGSNIIGIGYIFEFKK